MKMTGLRKSVRGSSLRNESPIAARTISREKMLCFGRVTGALLVECEVELEHVDAGLAEEAEPAAVGVLVDQLLDALGESPRTSATRAACSCA